MFTLKVERVTRHNSYTATLHFSKALKSYPGQFVMLNLFGVEEIPLSLSSPRSVTVKAVGETTERLVNFSGGEAVGVRGPFGNPFSPTSGSALIVAGGIGIAPMMFLYDFLERCGAKVRVIYGVKSREELLPVGRFEDLTVTTEDGSAGMEGTVLDALKAENLDGYDRIYACGPHGMIEALVDLFEKRNVIEKTEFSLERYMRCGIGVCGSCVIDNGLRVCADGPVFSGRQLR